MLVCCQGTALAETINFDDLKPGAPPPGWTAAQTGSGSAKWSVEKDDSGAEQAKRAKAVRLRRRSPSVSRTTRISKTRFVEVKFKPVAAAGRSSRRRDLARAKDANNYYIARANALEGNVVLYKTVNGKRSSLDIVGRKGGYGVKEPVGSGQWHTLRVEFAGNRFKLTFDGKHLFDGGGHNIH